MSLLTSGRPSSTARKLSPGTVKIVSTPCKRRHSATSWPPVREVVGPVIEGSSTRPKSRGSHSTRVVPVAGLGYARRVPRAIVWKGERHGKRAERGGRRGGGARAHVLPGPRSGTAPAGPRARSDGARRAQDRRRDGRDLTRHRQSREGRGG